MDIDPNDLLSTNVYIKKPDLNPSVSLDSNEEFRKYYEKELQIKQDAKIMNAIQNIELDEEDDDNHIMNTNMFNKVNVEKDNIEERRFIRDVRTLVSIDSRDRIKTIYPRPSQFKIFLGRTFTNVRKIEMVSLEFPNTSAVINTNNNRIYWRNIEDIDYDYTVTTNGIVGYPIYNVELRTGSYTSATLQSEIQSKLNLVRRRQGTTTTPSITPDYHTFVVDLDLNTDVVSLTSLSVKTLPNNPLSTVLASGVITVLLPEHGYSTNDFIYLLNAKGIAGIPSTTLLGFHRITVIGPNQFTFEVNVKASEAVSGGGNSVKTGTKAPFQFLWGENNFTVAQNIGFPLENSSELIKTNVESLENIVQMDIILNYAHNFRNTYEYIGQIISVGTLVSNVFVTYASYVITNIVNTIGIRVQVASESVITGLIGNASANLFKFGDLIIPVSSYSKYVVDSFLVTTYTAHNYNFNDINTTITLSNTTDPNVDDDVSYDGNYLLQAVPSTTTFIVPGVLGPQNIHTSNIYGTLPRKTPLTTWIVNIVSVVNNYIRIDNLWYVKIVTDVPHKMLEGEQVMIYNLKTNPLLNSEYTIYSVLTSTSFLIQATVSTVDFNNSINPFVATGLVTFSFPSHGFNSIINIQNGTVFDLTDSFGTPVPIQPIIITTTVPHNLEVNDIVRLSGTGPIYVNSVLTTGVEPSLDGGGYVVYAINAVDRFTIVKVAGTSDSFTPITAAPTITGVLGLNNNFYLYDVENIGGMSKTMLNNRSFTVRDVIDEDTFTFIASNVYATSIETGGGSNVHISSLKHGFNGIQTNTKNDILNRSINLQGEDYCFLTCPQLDTMLNTGDVRHIFSRISLDQPPGFVCFKYLSNPKQFHTMPLDRLSELEFSVVNYDGSLYDFNDLDFSFTLEITEATDATKSFNISSRRGITDIS